ncbi:hypothetical protein HMPREF3215_00385 [Staphylococcus simulans]|nr:hypothetical protein HMPREF3215_00385 [Staphylococcus simulans]
MMYSLSFFPMYYTHYIEKMTKLTIIFISSKSPSEKVFKA